MNTAELVYLNKIADAAWRAWYDARLQRDYARMGGADGAELARLQRVADRLAREYDKAADAVRLALHSN